MSGLETGECDECRVELFVIGMFALFLFNFRVETCEFRARPFDGVDLG